MIVPIGIQNLELQLEENLTQRCEERKEKTSGVV